MVDQIRITVEHLINGELQEKTIVLSKDVEQVKCARRDLM